MGQRLERVKENIHRELAEILLKEGDFARDILVTLTRVDVSPDLQAAAVYISVMPESETKNVFRSLRRNIYGLQQMLNRRIRTRPVPRIRFVEEKDTKEAGKIEALLEKIKTAKTG